MVKFDRQNLDVA